MALNKTLGLLIIGLLLTLTGSSWDGFVYAADDLTAPPNVSSEAAILIDQRSGTVLYAKNEEERLYPASITKIATAIIALEHSKLDEVVTVSKTAREEEGTRIYLAEGEQLTMQKLLYGLMLNSGNDAATAVAEHIDGTKAQFAERMNDFMTHTVGALHTHFTNPSGLPDELHYTTAGDMAKLARYAMENATFRQIVSTKKMPWEGKEWTSNLENHNKMLTTYPGATGIKNGYTVAAGNTLVTSATRGGLSLIGVVLKAGSNKLAYSDMTAMLDYGFAHFETKSLFAAGEAYSIVDEGAILKFTSPEAIWGVYPIGETPRMEVSTTGEVSLTSSLGTSIAGQLTLEKNAVHTSAYEAKSKAALHTTAAKSNDRLSEMQVWSWLASIVPFLAAIRIGLRKYVRKHQGTGIEQG